MDIREIEILKINDASCLICYFSRRGIGFISWVTHMQYVYREPTAPARLQDLQGLSDHGILYLERISQDNTRGKCMYVVYI